MKNVFLLGCFFIIMGWGCKDHKNPNKPPRIDPSVPEIRIFRGQKNDVYLYDNVKDEDVYSAFWTAENFDQDIISIQITRGSSFRIASLADEVISTKATFVLHDKQGLQDSQEVIIFIDHEIETNEKYYDPIDLDKDLLSFAPLQTLYDPAKNILHSVYTKKILGDGPQVQAKNIGLYYIALNSNNEIVKNDLIKNYDGGDLHISLALHPQSGNFFLASTHALSELSGEAWITEDVKEIFGNFSFGFNPATHVPEAACNTSSGDRNLYFSEKGVNGWETYLASYEDAVFESMAYNPLTNSRSIIYRTLNWNNHPGYILGFSVSIDIVADDTDFDVNTSCLLKYDSKGIPHIIYGKFINTSLNHAWVSDGMVHKEEIDNNCDVRGAVPGFIIAPDDSIYVCYTKLSSEHWANILMLAHSKGDGWEKGTIAQNILKIDFGPWTSVAIDNMGKMSFLFTADERLYFIKQK